MRRPTSEAKISTDNFLIAYFFVRRHEERIAAGRARAVRFVSPWQPAGTLAVQIFNAIRIDQRPPGWAKPGWEAAEAFVRQISQVRNRRLRSTLEPSRDLMRLRQTFHGARVPAATWVSIRPADLQRARLNVEFTVMSRRKRGSRFTALQKPAGLDWVVWEGVAGEADVFRTTPLGATILSSVYGVARGELRACRGCWAFFIPPRLQWARRYCDDCRALRPSAKHEHRSLAYWKQERWQLVMDRMRRRGFARLGIVGRAAQEKWRAAALQALHRISTRAGVLAWEEHFAPRGRAGRPRKHRPTEQDPTTREGVTGAEEATRTQVKGRSSHHTDGEVMRDET